MKSYVAIKKTELNMEATHFGHRKECPRMKYLSIYIPIQYFTTDTVVKGSRTGRRS